MINIFPNITRHYVENEIKNIVKEISNLLTEQMSALEKVSIINDILYEEYKFRGDKEITIPPKILHLENYFKIKRKSIDKFYFIH